MPKYKGRDKKLLKIRKNVMLTQKVWDLAQRSAYDMSLNVSQYIGLLILKANKRDEQGRTIYMRNKEKQEMITNEDDFELGDE